MERALPVAVKFLQKGNKELSKNLASYLSLAAIEYAYLLGPHITQILDSIAIGNYGLCQILPQIYEISSPVLDKKVFILVPLLRTCEVHDKLALLQLFSMILRRNPAALEGSISQICDTLPTDSAPVLTSTMNLLLRVAEEFPARLHNHFPKIREAAEKHPSCAAAIASQVLTTAGKSNRSRAQFALDFVLEHLPGADRTTQTILLRDATILCSTYPVLFNEKVLACVRQKNNLSPSSKIKTAGATTTTTTTMMTSFDEETTTTTAPVAIMRPVATKVTHVRDLRAERVNGMANGSAATTITTTTTTTTTTSGGVTIVKLNVAPIPVMLQSNHVDSTTTPVNSMAAISESKDKPAVVNGGATSPPHTG